MQTQLTVKETFVRVIYSTCSLRNSPIASTDLKAAYVGTGDIWRSASGPRERGTQKGKWRASESNKTKQQGCARGGSSDGSCPYAPDSKAPHTVTAFLTTLHDAFTTTIPMYCTHRL